MKTIRKSFISTLSGCLVSTLMKLFAMTILLWSIAGAGDLRAQTLGVVWSKTYGAGNIRNIKHNTDGTYTACGEPWTAASPDNGNDKLYGLIIEFDESGNEIRRATVKIPQSYITGRTVTRALAIFNVAFKTPDGGFFAAGTLRNIDAPSSEKGPNWGGTDHNLHNGTWLVKLDASLNVVLDTIVQGLSVTDGHRMEDGNFLIAGCDDPAIRLFMLRKYSQSGTLISYSNSSYREIASIYKYPNIEEYIASTPDQQLRISTSSLTPSPISANTVQGNSYATSITPGPSNGFFLNYYKDLSSNNATSYNNGNIFAKYISGNSTAVYAKDVTPADTLFLAPLLLPGTENKYIGTAQTYGGSSVNITGNYMYELTDIVSNSTPPTYSYTYRVGASYPNNTALKTVSQTDGFLSCGTTDNTGAGQAAIAKLSTCANFVLDVGNTAENLMLKSGSAYFEGRTFSLNSTPPFYTGQTGTVTYTWTLTDITPGGPAVTPTSLGITSGGSNTTYPNIPAQTFVLDSDKTFAVLRYTIIATDTYTGGSCTQSKTILVKITDYPDNVSDAACYIDPKPSVWGINSVMSNESNLSPYQTPIVGDIDNDGIVEIITAMDPVITSASEDLTKDRLAPRIAIYKGNDITQLPFVFPTTQSYNWNYRLRFGLVKTTISGRDSCLIVVLENDKYLRAYNSKGNLVWTSSVVLNFADGISPTFADFNRDGIPEIAMDGKLFNSVNGQLLCEISPRISYMNTTHWAMVIAADIFNTGELKYIIGNSIYDVNVNGSNVITSLTLNKTITPPVYADFALDTDNGGATFSVPDGGRPLVVDVDNDGMLDLVISYYVGGTTLHQILYVADPVTGKIKAVKRVPNVSVSSYPFAGDIDGDGKTEFVFIKTNAGTTNLIMAYRYVVGNPVLQPFWTMSHTDNSGLTGITLFDFDQDGKAEMVYRDQTHLRIIDGSAATSSYPDRNKAAISNLAGTSAEYPVVADVDSDGQAEIIIVGGQSGDPGRTFYTGRLWVYKSDDPVNNPWAPARKVWNQYAYTIVGVNEDLSVPKVPFNTATVFPGKDGIFNTADDVRPFNNFLQQATTMNKFGVPIWLAPHAITIPPEFEYSSTYDSVTVHISVVNTGDAAFQAPFHITVYKDIAATGSKKYVYEYPQMILAGDTADIVFGIPHFKADGWTPFTKIIIRTNDNGNGFTSQSICDSAYIERDFTTGSVIAIDDYLMLPVNTSANTRILVTRNDFKPCPTAAINVVSPGGGAKHGNYSVENNDSVVVYRPDANFTGVDTIKYRLRCTSGTGDVDTASVYIMVTKPPTLQYLACEGAPVTLSFDHIAGITYDWYNDNNGAAGTLRKSGSDTIVVTKTTAAQQTFWAKLKFNDIEHAVYRIDLNRSDDCGIVNPDPNSCAATGTLLFKEDFGGNEPGDDEIKQAGIPQVGYAYDNTSPYISANGSYVIAKHSPAGADNYFPNAWYENIDDHTYPNDLGRGYLMAVNAASTKGQLYKCQIDDLCSDTKLSFSVWLMSLIKLPTYKDHVNLVFEITDTDNNMLAKYFTGNVLDVDSIWKNYGFEFAVPAGYSSVIMTVYNNGTGGSGNDLLMDDIEIRFCTPPVTVSQPSKTDTTVCVGTAFQFSASYTDGTPAVLGSSLVYRWEYAASTSNVNLPASWSPVSGTSGNVTNGVVNSTYSISPVATSHAGYYRLAIANNAINLGNYNCRAMSDIIRLRVNPLPELMSDAERTICSGTSTNYTATSSIATGTTFSWTRAKVTNITPDTGSGTDALIDETLTNSSTAPVTVTYKVTLTANGCSKTHDVKITVNPKPTITNTTTAMTVCSGGSVPAINFTTSVTNATVTYHWTATNHASMGLTSSSGTGNISTSAQVNNTNAAIVSEITVTPKIGTCEGTPVKFTVTVYAVVKGGKIGTSKNICYNTLAGEISNVDLPTGGNSNYTYGWEYRTKTGASSWSAWTTVTGATANEYTPAGTLTATTQYRRQAQNSCNNAYSDTVTITVYDKLTGGKIESNQNICYNEIPVKLVNKTLPAGGDGYYSYEWQSSSDGTNFGTATGTNSNGAEYSFTNNFTQTMYYRRKVTGGSSCGDAFSDTVTIKVYPQAILNYPDLRLRACHSTVAGTAINLSKYIDTVEVTKVEWSGNSGMPAIGDQTGIIAANELIANRTYTYTYSVTNPCVTGMTRKVYIKTLNGDTPRLQRDTIAVCYDRAEAININQIFGIDAGGSITWSPSPAIDTYVATSAAFGGAVIMNGKAIYENNVIGTAYNYHGTAVKKVEFTYTSAAGSCLSGKTFKVVIILTPAL